MINGHNEKELAASMRLLARQYCDGAFNKSEYRRRRREILKLCVDEAPAVSNELPPVSRPQPGSSATAVASGRGSPMQRDWTPYLMVGVTLVVLGVMGFLLVSMI